MKFEKDEILPRVGRMEQLASIRRYVLDDGKGRIHYRRAFNLLRKLNRHLDPGEPPWMFSIQTHKVLGLR